MIYVNGGELAFLLVHRRFVRNYWFIEIPCIMVGNAVYYKEK